MDLKRCKGCDLEEFGMKPETFTRWRNSDVLYHWVQCGDAPACRVGPCDKDADKAEEGWNKMIEESNKMEALEGSSQNIKEEGEQCRKENTTK